MDSQKNIKSVVIFHSLKTKSKEIVSKMVPIMEQLLEEENEIVDEVEYVVQLPRATLLAWLQQYALSLIADAEHVKNEIETFEKYYALGPEKLEKEMQKYPFLACVWYGDTYDGKDEFEALIFLLKNLSEESSNLDENHLIDSAISHFQK